MVLVSTLVMSVPDGEAFIEKVVMLLLNRLMVGERHIPCGLLGSSNLATLAIRILLGVVVEKLRRLWLVLISSRPGVVVWFLLLVQESQWVVCGVWVCSFLLVTTWCIIPLEIVIGCVGLSFVVLWVCRGVLVFCVSLVWMWWQLQVFLDVLKVVWIRGCRVVHGLGVEVVVRWLQNASCGRDSVVSVVCSLKCFSSWLVSVVSLVVARVDRLVFGLPPSTLTAFLRMVPCSLSLL